MAIEYLKKSDGGLPKPHREFLTANVADAFETYLGIKPTTTKVGLFPNILSVVITEITGKEGRSVHGLVGRAL